MYHGRNWYLRIRNIDSVSDEILNEHGYLQARKKGLMRNDDLKKRLDFAKYYKNNYPANFWTDHVSFYLDGTGFAYKTNPLDQAKAPKGRTWRKKSEGLKLGCTGKGRKEGTGGRVLKLMVAISYDKGIVVCEPCKKCVGHIFLTLSTETLKACLKWLIKE